MNKIIKNRQTGKTEELIRISAEKQIPIIVKDVSTKRMLKLRAENEGYNIPEPISVPDICTNDREIHHVLVDDAEWILIGLLNYHNIHSVDAMAITDRDLPEFNKPKKFSVKDFMSVLTNEHTHLIIYDTQAQKKVYDNTTESCSECMSDDVLGRYIKSINMDIDGYTRIEI